MSVRGPDRIADAHGCQDDTRVPTLYDTRKDAKMRSVWNGGMAVGLLSLPVKLYPATGEDEYAFNQVHQVDGGRIRYRRRCEICNAAVEFPDIGKGKEVGGEMIVLTDEDLDSLPVVGAKIVQIDRFVRIDTLDLTSFGKAYYIEPDAGGLKAYTLLRQAMKTSSTVAVARFAMRVKDSLAIIRPHDKMLILQLVAWPSDVREPSFSFLAQDVTVTETERDLAAQLITTMSAPFKPEDYHSEYAAAVEKLIQSKIDGTPPPEPTAQQAAAVADIGAVLTASIAQAKGEAA